MKNSFEHETDFSLSIGWALASEHFETIRDRRIDIIMDQGEVDVPAVLPCAKPINPVLWDSWRVNGS